MEFQLKLMPGKVGKPETGQNEVDRQNGDLSYHDPLPLGELQ